MKTRLEVTLRRPLCRTPRRRRFEYGTGVGVDVEPVHTFEVSEAFLRRNFTDAEIAYARVPVGSVIFAGRWAAKEAVVKAMSSCSLKPFRSGRVPVRRLRTLRLSDRRRGTGVGTAMRKKLRRFSVWRDWVSISHTESVAVSQALVL